MFSDVSKYFILSSFLSTNDAPCGFMRAHGPARVHQSDAFFHRSGGLSTYHSCELLLTVIDCLGRLTFCNHFINATVSCIRFHCLLDNSFFRNLNGKLAMKRFVQNGYVRKSSDALHKMIRQVEIFSVIFWCAQRRIYSNSLFLTHTYRYKSSSITP